MTSVRPRRCKDLLRLPDPAGRRLSKRRRRAAAAGDDLGTPRRGRRPDSARIGPATDAPRRHSRRGRSTHSVSNAQFTPPAGHDKTVLSVSYQAARQARSASECVRRSHCAARHTPTQTRHRTHLSGGRAGSVHTTTPDTTKQSCLCRVWRSDVNWAIATNVLRLQIFWRQS